MTTEQFDGFRLHTVGTWSEKAKGELVEILRRTRGRAHGGLSGRAPIVHATIDGIGRVVVKQYTRGGLFRYLVSDRYFRWGPTRPEAEFEIVTGVRALGGAAPEPLAWVDRGTPFYRAWLVSREIEHHATLAEISRADDDRTRGLLDAVVHQIEILIEQRIVHVDLHPGNVVVDENNRVFILDFDRAHRFVGTRNALRDRYLHRWRRAVIKHRLPDVLAEYICLGLRRNFSEGLAEGVR